MQLKGIVITVNYPDDTVEAAVPSELSDAQLAEFIRRLCRDEPEMTSFVVVAAVA